MTDNWLLFPVYGFQESVCPQPIHPRIWYQATLPNQLSFFPFHLAISVILFSTYFSRSHFTIMCRKVDNKIRNKLLREHDNYTKIQLRRRNSDSGWVHTHIKIKMCDIFMKIYLKLANSTQLEQKTDSL